MDDVELLTVEEVARLLSLSRMTIYRLMADGDLTFVKIGRARRITARSVRSYLSRLSGEDETPSASQRRRTAVTV